MPAQDLPEGTDAVITGAGVDASDESAAERVDEAAAAMTTSAAPPTPAPAKQASEPELPQSFSSRIEGFKDQAGDRARSFVADAKDRATGSIDDIVRMIHDAANEVDDKVGTQYGDYIRRAADSVSGLSDAIKDKEVDDLFADARGLIARSPGVTVGIAAAVGFVIARLAKAGAEAAVASDKAA